MTAGQTLLPFMQLERSSGLDFARESLANVSFSFYLWKCELALQVILLGCESCL